MQIGSKLPLSLIFLFTASLSFTQVPLKPLFEEVTSSTCGPCNSANQILDPILDSNHDTHSAIKYQIDFPGEGDPYFIDACRVRADYYSVAGVPSLFVDGMDAEIFDMSQAVYDGFLGETTNIDIEIVNATIDADYQVELEININALGSYPAGLKAHVAIVEKQTVNNFQSNGETEFFNVLMQMLPNEQGTTLPQLTAGQSQTLNLSQDMKQTYMEGPADLQVVVFVQDDNTKAVVQSENKDIEGSFATYNVQFDVTDTDGNIITGAKVFLNNHGAAYTDGAGNADYTVVTSSSLDYVVSFPGLLRAYGTVTVGNEDVTESVVLEIPDVFYYADFEVVQPTDWFPIFNLAGGLDRVYWYEGKWIVFRQSGTFDPLYLASPGFDLKANNGGTIVFHFAASTGDPEFGFGTMSDPYDVSTMDEITSFFVTTEDVDYEYDLSSLSDEENVHFYWQTKSETFSWYEIDYVYITKGDISAVDKTVLSQTKIYPNPTSDFLKIEMDAHIESVSIFDLNSKLVKQVNVGSNKASLNMSSFVSGLYTVKIESEIGVYIKPIVIR